MVLGSIARKSFGGIVAVVLTTGVCVGQTRSAPVDPGVRGGPAGAGTPLKSLTADETAFFQPLAARCRWIEPSAKSLDRSCHLEWCEEHCAMVHHAKWSGPRSAVQAERQRGE